MPSHHSSSSHSSHSSSSHSSHSHSSRSSSHSGSSHSSSYRGASRAELRDRYIKSHPNTRPRMWVPPVNNLRAEKIHYGRMHDYYYYRDVFRDPASEREYAPGYYDENGQYYEDIVFTQNGQVPADAQVLCVCEYCRTKQIVKWQEGELKCQNCGGSLKVLSHFDELKSDSELYDTERLTADFDRQWKQTNGRKYIALFIVITVLLSPCLIGLPLSILFNAIDGSSTSEQSYESTYEEDTTKPVTYNIPELSEKMFLKADGDGYVLTTREDYKANHETGDYKRLLLDEDGNYYDKKTDCYVWLNEDIEPPQFQYWYEGISSDYGDYGWMERDEDEGEWYIEATSGNWIVLPEKYSRDGLWHINYDFVEE